MLFDSQSQINVLLIVSFQSVILLKWEISFVVVEMNYRKFKWKICCRLLHRIMTGIVENVRFANRDAKVQLLIRRCTLCWTKWNCLVAILLIHCFDVTFFSNQILVLLRKTRPFFTDFIPFVDIVTDYFLEDPIRNARQLGRCMLDPTNPVKTYVNRIIDICIEKGINMEKRVLFIGIGTGASLGKLVSIQLS